MISFRGFLYFVIGVLIAASTSLSFAMPYRVGKYYTYNNSVTRRFTTYNEEKEISNTVLNIYKEDARTVSVTTQFAVNQESMFMQMPVIDTVKIGLDTFEQMAENGAKKGLAGGAAGVLGGMAASMVADWMVQKGWQWMKDAQCQVTDGCWGQPSSPNTPYDPIHDIKIGSQYCDGGYFCWSPPHYFYTISNASKTDTQDVYDLVKKMCSDLNMRYYGGASCGSSVSGNERPADVVVVNSATPNIPRSSSPVSDSDLIDAIKNKLADATTLANFVKAIASDGTIMSLADSTPTSTSGGPYQGISHSLSESTPLSDGGTQKRITTETPFFTAKGDGTLAGPITINKSGDTTTTTTETCTGAGSCSTTNNTSSRSYDQAPNETKTDCEKNPDMVQCAGFGTPPAGDIPQDTQNVSFSYNPFSMPATCPAPVTFSVMGKSYSVKYDPICQFATYIRGLVLISALIAAYFICFGTRKEGV